MTNPGEQGSLTASVAVLDVGKTHIKMSAVTPSGVIAETLSTENPVKPGPPWLHHDTPSVAGWALESLAHLSRHHPLTDLVVSGHGSCCALVGADIADGDEPLLPMMDYEEPIDPELGSAYQAMVGPFADRGSTIMMGTSHMARQLFVMQKRAPEIVAKAGWLLALPQYWAFRFSGIAASEYTSLGAQSHLWNVAERRPTKLARDQDWTRFLPPIKPAWEKLGPLRKDLKDRYNIIGDIQVCNGIHDSSASFYRYQAAGLARFSVVSTGTWIVGLSDGVAIDLLDENRGMTINSDVHGHPVGGVLGMAGRDYAAIAGQDQTPASMDRVLAILAAGLYPLPSFSGDNGMFPGSAGKGRIIGQVSGDRGEARSLAVLLGALETAECLSALHSDGRIVLDGAFVKDPVYARLVASILGRPVEVDRSSHGVTSGAALLASHADRTGPARLDLEKIDPDNRLENLNAYYQNWRALAFQNAARPQANNKD